MCRMIIIFFLSVQALFAQQHYLVSPAQEIIPLKSHQSASSIIKRSLQKPTTTDPCSNSNVFGYLRTLYPPNSYMTCDFKDVLGEWFVAPATGTIDTIFWPGGPEVSAVDSIVYVRIHNSFIGPTYGPGIRPGPFDPPCQNWGYWINLSDTDGGIAPFQEDAFPTPATFQSTIANGTAGPPFGEELWGSGGYPVVMHPNSINHVAMMDLGIPCSVSVGQVFFISMSPKSSPLPDGVVGSTDFISAELSVQPAAEIYPSRDWKYYEHDSGPSYCSGFPTTSIKRGWVARGSDGPDSTNVLIYNWWYTMTATSNSPPSIMDAEPPPRNCLAGSPSCVWVSITDCDPANPGLAGIQTPIVQWSLDGVPQTPITMVLTTGTIWTACIPNPASGYHVIDYDIEATDLEGATTIGPPHEYRIIDLHNAYYVIDTLSSCATHSIAATGTVIPPSAFFDEVQNLNPADDGQAGPFRIPKGPMTLFGDTASCAWIGVNGALALSKSPADTLDIGSGGAFTASWTFPMPQRHGRSDTHGVGLPPKNLVAPYYADLLYADSFRQYGTIRYASSPDSCEFIVEWDSLANAGSAWDSTANPTFRTILNRCDRTILFEYDFINESNNGFEPDPDALVGMQADSNALTAGYTGAVPGNVFINKGGYPSETAPRSGMCIRFTPGAALYARAGWNLLALSFTPPHGDFNFSDNYPGARGPFVYNGSEYKPPSILSNGVGFWAKYANPVYAGAPGYPITLLYDTVDPGWNIIGTISAPLKTAQITGSNLTWSPNFFSFDGSGYRIVHTLLPGYGYWVKTVQTGAYPHLILNASSPALKPAAEPSHHLEELARIEICDASGKSQTLYLGPSTDFKPDNESFEMPPSSFGITGFDARFASGSMVATFPSGVTPSVHLQYPVKIQSTSYPVRVSLKSAGTQLEGVHLALRTERGGLLGTLRESGGTVTVTNPATGNVVLTLNDNAPIPKVLTLYQNYPNPFNPSTEIRYDVPFEAHVKLTVHDILGRGVMTLVDGMEEPGERSVLFDASTYSSGVYFFTMTSGAFHQTRKMLIVK